MFREYVSSNFDTNGDGYLNDDERESVNGIFMGDKDITSLKGLEYFTALHTLSCDGNQLTTLDVSKNTALTTLDCYDNQLTELDVSKNTALTTLDCSNNQLTSLTFENNSKLERLNCENNNLTQLDISGCSRLQRVSSYFFGHDSNVKIIDGTYRPINETNFPDAVFREYVSSNFDTDEDGYLNDEEIESATKINLGKKGITSLKGLKYFTALTSLNCWSNQLTELDVLAKASL